MLWWLAFTRTVVAVLGKWRLFPHFLNVFCNGRCAPQSLLFQYFILTFLCISSHMDLLQYLGLSSIPEGLTSPSQVKPQLQQHSLSAGEEVSAEEHRGRVCGISPPFPVTFLCASASHPLMLLVLGGIHVPWQKAANLQAFARRLHFLL